MNVWGRGNEKKINWRRAVTGQGVEGQTTLEFALGMILFIFIILAVIQFGIVMYAQNVVTEASQEGARVAASADRGINDGMAVATRNLNLGLGDVAKNVTGSVDDESVIVETSVQLRSFLPFVSSFVKFELRGKANMFKEGWRS